MTPSRPDVRYEPRIRSARLHAVDPSGYRFVSVRLREGEFNSFSQQANRMGITHNMALRIAARRIAGFLELDAPTRTALQDIANNIGDISKSIRQLSGVARQSDGPAYNLFTEQRAAFGAEFVALDRLLRRLLTVSLRRTDGCAMISEADDQ